jgi:hypothetical protein
MKDARWDKLEYSLVLAALLGRIGSVEYDGKKGMVNKQLM